MTQAPPRPGQRAEDSALSPDTRGAPPQAAGTEPQPAPGDALGDELLDAVAGGINPHRTFS